MTVTLKGILSEPSGCPRSAAPALASSPASVENDWWSRVGGVGEKEKTQGIPLVSSLVCIGGLLHA